MFTKQAMVITVSRSVKQEIAALCSDKFPSVFKKSAECFEVDTVITEVHSRAPTLFSLLRSALRTKTSRRNEGMIIVVIVVKLLIMKLLVVLVAVAVKAITPTVSGFMLHI